MFKSYLKSAVRNLMKFKFISFINLFGLAVGLSCCLLIFGFVLHELSYDRYHENASNIYRVERSFVNPETGIPSLELGSAAPAVGSLMENDFDEIKELTRIVAAPGSTTLTYDDKTFKGQKVYFAGENFMKIFDINVLKGNPEKALTDPFSIIITEEMADKYFRGEEAVGKILRLNNELDLRVSAVYESFPANSHIHPQMIISMSTMEDEAWYGEGYLTSNWSNNSFFTYILLPEGYNHENLEAKLPDFLDRHIKEDYGLKPSKYNSLSLKPLTDIHLYSQTDLEAEENGNIKRVYIFSAIAIFILLIACINYMNLSTARSLLRAKEVGVRKVIGARKNELVTQFLSESVLISWIALILAFALTWLAFPFLSKISGQEISFEILLNWKILLPLLMIPFIVGIVSGIYPAFFLSSFQAAQTLKGVYTGGKNGATFRKALVVLQFSISVILIIGTVVVLEQLKFMQEKPLGFEREQVITITNNSALSSTFDAFRNELEQNPSIKEIGRSSLIPTDNLLDAMQATINHGDSMAPTTASIKFVTVDDNFIPTYGISLIAGRNFSREFGRDTSSFIINEAALGVLGVQTAQEALGKEFHYGDRSGRLVGVVKDFNFESLHKRILPLVFFKPSQEGAYRNISVKLSEDNFSDGIEHLEKTWQRFVPEAPFEYKLLESTYENLYRTERRQSTIFLIFSCVAIGIACLGLFGLSAFTIGQRLKEIGIRRVLGAKTSSIVALLSKDFLKLVILAAVMAFPVAWFAMNAWLKDFAYRIDIPVWSFIAAGLVAVFIAFLTISFLTIRAATANPVKNLRIE